MEVAPLRLVIRALIPLIPLCLALSFTPPALAAPAPCEGPVSLQSLVDALASPELSEKIVTLEHRAAGALLEDIQGRMSCLEEPVTPTVVAELWYLKGMVALYELTGRGVAEGAPMPGVEALFRASLYVDERRAFDEARFGTYGRVYWDRAQESLTDAAAIPLERPFVSVGRQWVDGRSVNLVYNRPLRPGQHFLQHFYDGRWRSSWFEVSESAKKASPRSQFAVPADPMLQLDLTASGALHGCPVGGLEASARVLPQGDRLYVGAGGGALFGGSSLMSCGAQPQQVYNQETGLYEEAPLLDGLVTVPWRLEGGLQMPLPALNVSGGLVYRGYVGQDANRATYSASDSGKAIGHRHGLGISGDVLLGKGDWRLRLRAEVSNMRRGNASVSGIVVSAGVGLTFMFSDATYGRTGVE